MSGDEAGKDGGEGDDDGGELHFEGYSQVSSLLPPLSSQGAGFVRELRLTGWFV